MPMFNRPGLPMDPRYGNVAFGALPTNARGENPHDLRQRQNRMQSFESRMAEFPGAAPGGTGATGIQPNLGITGLDDWTALLEDQQQYAADAGDGPLTQRGGFGGYGSRGGGGRGGGGSNAALQQLQQLAGGRGRGGDGGGFLTPSMQYQIGKRTTDAFLDQTDPQKVALQQLQELSGQRRAMIDDAQGPLGQRTSLLQAAGIGEDIADLQSGREADRFFQPGQKGMRAEQERMALAPVRAKVAGEQNVSMLDNETKLLLAQLGIREQELENLSAQDVAALRGLAQVMSGQYGVGPEDPEAQFFQQRLGGSVGGSGGGSF